MARTPRYGPAARQAVFQALTRRAGADVSGSVTADVGAQLRAAFGVSRRDPTRPDTAAAAAALGVSQRQVQRYLSGTNQPSPSTAQRLARAARQAATTQRGRRRAVASARGAAGQQGIRISITGQQGPDPDYTRPRTITMSLDPELASRLYGAYIDRGDQGALDFLAANSEQTYFIDTWHFDDISDTNTRNRDDL